jgi:hypothetical protein
MALIIPEFTKLEFIGSRFESHSLPTDVARDLIAYESLLIKLAKKLYIQDNPNIQKIPKEFSNLYFAIETIGSGIISLSLISKKDYSLQTSASLFDNYDSYLKKSHDLIADCIEFKNNFINQDFPKKLLSHFNQFGRSLKDGESLVLTRSDNSTKVIMTPLLRKKLVIASHQDSEREIELLGSIIRINADLKNLILKLEDGTLVSIPLPKIYKEKLNDFFDSNRNLIHITGIGSFDYDNKLKKIKAVNSLEFIKNLQLTKIFNELSLLKNGWCDGDCFALDSRQLQIISTIFIDNYPESLPLPLIVPTFDGNIMVEWNIVGYPSIDINIKQNTAIYQAFGLNGDKKYIEKYFALTDKDDINEFFNFLIEHINYILSCDA